MAAKKPELLNPYVSIRNHHEEGDIIATLGLDDIVTVLLSC